MKISAVGFGAQAGLEPAVGDRLSCLASAASCWFMAGMFIRAWWWPRGLDDGRWVKLGVGIMILEFILIHSGAFLNHFMEEKAGAGRAVRLLGLTLLYAVFGCAIAFAFRSWWILGSFAFVVAGRFWSVVAAESEMSRALAQRRVAASAIFFLVLTFATVFIPVPTGGITPRLLREVWPDRRSGLWEIHPERALAMGATYFFLLGLVELRPPRSWRPPVEAVGAG